MQYEADEHWLTTRYLDESSELHWSEFGEVLKTDDAWLLMMAEQERFISLSVEQVPEDALMFIARKIADSDSQQPPHGSSIQDNSP